MNRHILVLDKIEMNNQIADNLITEFNSTRHPSEQVRLLAQLQAQEAEGTHDRARRVDCRGEYGQRVAQWIRAVVMTLEDAAAFVRKYVK